MIAHLEYPAPIDVALRLACAFRRMVRNRRALRDLDAAQLADCGITREALSAATDWRFWRRLESMQPLPRSRSTVSMRGWAPAGATASPDPAH